MAHFFIQYAQQSDLNKKATLRTDYNFIHTIYVYSDTPQPRHRPISLLMTFFNLHPIAIDFSSIESFLQFFSGLCISEERWNIYTVV
jgi:hypothetical protein